MSEWRYVLERPRCSTLFHLRIESILPSLWVPSPCFTPYAPFTALCPLGFVVPVSLCPFTPLPLSPYNRTYPDTLPTNGRVFLWSSCCSPSHHRYPQASNPSTS